MIDQSIVFGHVTDWLFGGIVLVHYFATRISLRRSGLRKGLGEVIDALFAQLPALTKGKAARQHLS